MHNDSIASLNPEGNLANMEKSAGIFKTADEILDWIIPKAKWLLGIGLAMVVIVSTVNYCKSLKQQKVTDRKARYASVPVAPALPPAIVAQPPLAGIWAPDQTFPLEKGKWSPRISPQYYNAEEGLHEIMLDGNEKDIRPWNVQSRPLDEIQVKVPARVKFIQIRSVLKDTTVYGTPKDS